MLPAVHRLFRWHVGRREARERPGVSRMRGRILLNDAGRDEFRRVPGVFERDVLKRHARTTGKC